MNLPLIFILLFSLSAYSQDTIGPNDLKKITKPSDLDKYEEATFLDVKSKYLGVKKSCGFTKFPEEYTQDFRQGGKFPELKKYYELKREVEGLKKSLSVENDGEYVRRRKEFWASQEGVAKLQKALLERVPMDKIRNKKLTALLEGDQKDLEKHILSAGDNTFGLGFVYEHPDVKDALFDIKERFKQEIKEYPRAQDHFRAYGKGVEENSKRSRRLYPSRKHSLKEMEKDKEIMELSKKYDEYQLDEKIKNHEEYKKSKNLTIVFEGTGQYSPKLERNMKLIQTKLGMNPAQKDIEAGIDKALELSDDKAYMVSQGGNSTWSGTIRGPIAKGLYANKKGESNFRNSQWLYLPSEQDNFLAGDLDSFTGERMMPRKEAYSRGLQCLEKYLKMNPDTNLSIIGHSSGVKAAIDFAELIKKKGIKNKVDMLGIDPVDNMMKGALEGAISGSVTRLDKIGRALTPECWKTEEDKWRDRAKFEVGIISSKPRDALYKPDNASSFVSFYQTQDWKGLEIPTIEFGIHGSPIKNGENHHLRFNQESGQHHGMITQQDRVIQEFRRTLVR